MWMQYLQIAVYNIQLKKKLLSHKNYRVSL